MRYINVFCLLCQVPLILRDALQVTSQAADEAMTDTLKLAFELTGTIPVPVLV